MTAKPMTPASKNGSSNWQMRRAYGISESAAMFGVSRDVIRRAIKNKVIQTISIGDRILIPAAEIDRIAKEGI